MKKILLSLVVVGMLSFSTGCTRTYGGANVKNATMKTLNKQIVRNKTTKDEVTNMFGKPILTKETNGVEEWQYLYQEAKTDNKNLIPFVGLFTGGKTEIKQKLIVFVWNSDNTVKDFYIENRNRDKSIKDVIRFKK